MKKVGVNKTKFDFEGMWRREERKGCSFDLLTKTNKLTINIDKKKKKLEKGEKRPVWWARTRDLWW